MKHSGHKKGLLTAFLSALLLGASSVTFFIFYYLTRYLPFYLMAMTVLLPTVVYTVLLLVGLLRAPKEEAVDVSALAEGAGETSAEVPATEGKRRLTAKRIGHAFVRAGRAILRFFYLRRLWLIAIPTLIAGGVIHFFFWRMTGRMTSVYNVGYIVPVILLLLFILCVIFDKWCKYAESDSEYVTAVIRNFRTAFGVTRLAVLLTLVIVVIRLLGFYELQKWLAVAMYVIFVYESFFLLLSLCVRALRRELTEKPDLSIPMPQLFAASHELGVLSYLEENTGITMRSLWSIKFIKTLLPYTFIFACLILWFSTGLIQIEAHQHGAVYRFGRLQEKSLDMHSSSLLEQMT